MAFTTLQLVSCTVSNACGADGCLRRRFVDASYLRVPTGVNRSCTDTAINLRTHRYHPLLAAPPQSQRQATSDVTPAVHNGGGGGSSGRRPDKLAMTSSPRSSSQQNCNENARKLSTSGGVDGGGGGGACDSRGSCSASSSPRVDYDRSFDQTLQSASQHSLDRSPRSPRSPGSPRSPRSPGSPRSSARFTDNNSNYNKSETNLDTYHHHHAKRHARLGPRASSPSAMTSPFGAVTSETNVDTSEATTVPTQTHQQLATSATSGGGCITS